MLDSFSRVSLFPFRRETGYCSPLPGCEHSAAMGESDNVEFKENWESCFLCVDLGQEWDCCHPQIFLGCVHRAGGATRLSKHHALGICRALFPTSQEDRVLGLVRP